MEPLHTDSRPFAPRFCPGEPMERAAFLSELAAVLLPLRPDSRLLVAIDGVDGAGKTTFADELAGVLGGAGDGPQRRILRVTIDAFHNVRSVRYRRGRRSPEGFWRDSYNLEQFTEYALEPLASGAAWFRNQGHDLATDAVLDPEPVMAAKDAVVLIDGLFLHREELRNFWDFSVFLAVPFEVTASRMAARDGTGAGARQAGAANPGEERYVGGQRLYFAAEDPAARADLVLDNSRAGTLRVINGSDAGYRKRG
ncbi:uridine kinase [Arthrobacter sp. zg-Y1110]|uniref:uridine kinase n=1 Tax=Arthrobacter sp. zg-Y1110 TaxID=2886932 RepID=UPI001D13F96A|nr:uridine kinase [Arthrobacter sp. zg-Y1110]MCC3290447.1 uridine kinase [Arthrobacter sp. zg-Y1110]UWX84183.1 uridine kinase [Arthrobacter sp. zg-Y1110]